MGTFAWFVLFILGLVLIGLATTLYFWGVTNMNMIGLYIGMIGFGSLLVLWGGYRVFAAWTSKSEPDVPPSPPVETLGAQPGYPPEVNQPQYFKPNPPMYNQDQSYPDQNQYNQPYPPYPPQQYAPAPASYNGPNY